MSTNPAHKNFVVQFEEEQVIVFEAAFKVASMEYSEFVQVFEKDEMVQLEGQIINIGDTYWDMFIRINDVLYKAHLNSMPKVRRV